VSFGRPDIFNTDRESHFTSVASDRTGVRLSMDGRRLFVDNVLIKRLRCFHNSNAEFTFSPARLPVWEARHP